MQITTSIFIFVALLLMGSQCKQMPGSGGSGLSDEERPLPNATPTSLASLGGANGYRLQVRSANGGTISNAGACVKDIETTGELRDLSVQVKVSGPCQYTIILELGLLSKGFSSKLEKILYTNMQNGKGQVVDVRPGVPRLSQDVFVSAYTGPQPTGTPGSFPTGTPGAPPNGQGSQGGSGGAQTPDKLQQPLSTPGAGFTKSLPPKPIVYQENPPTDLGKEFYTKLKASFDSHCTSCHVEGGDAELLLLDQYPFRSLFVSGEDKIIAMLLDVTTAPEGFEVDMPPGGGGFNKADTDILREWVEKGQKK